MPGCDRQACGQLPAGAQQRHCRIHHKKLQGPKKINPGGEKLRPYPFSQSKLGIANVRLYNFLSEHLGFVTVPLRL